jgi:hypothetical protein
MLDRGDEYGPGRYDGIEGGVCKLARVGQRKSMADLLQHIGTDGLMSITSLFDSYPVHGIRFIQQINWLV